MKLTIAAVQMDCRLADRPANLSAMEDRTRRAAAQGAKLVVFPECALTGYCFESEAEARAQAETIPGPAVEAMGRLARELDLHLVFGLIEREGDRLYNALALVGPQGLLGPSYRKVHLPWLGLDRFSTPGDRPFRVWETPACRLGLNICYDGGFPESGRVMALQGADLIALPTNWPPGAEEFAEHGIITRALENHVYYAAVNRVGEERGFRFIGRSRIVDPHGRTLAVAGASGEEVLLAEVEPERARQKRIVRVPGKHVIDRIADRRPELYGPIVEPRTAKTPPGEG